MEATEKKGMSKGCMVGMIIAGVLLLIVIIGFTMCYIYKDDLVKMGGTTVINQIKTIVAEDTPDGVDTVQFNNMLDQFIIKADADSNSVVQYTMFIQGVQMMVGDEKISADEVKQIEAVVAQLYPELAPPAEAVDPSDAIDTTAVTETTE